MSIIDDEINELLGKEDELQLRVIRSLLSQFPLDMSIESGF